MLLSRRPQRFYSNDAGGPGGQVPQGTTSQELTPGTSHGNASAGQVPPTPSGDGLTHEQALAELAKVRQDAAKNRVDARRLQELEAAETARKQAELSDTQKAAQRAEAAEGALKAARERIGIAELKIAAQQAGISDPDLVADSLSLRSKLTFDDAGEPTNVADLIKQHKADKPHLYTGAAAGQSGAAAQQRPAASSSGGATNPGRAAGSGGLTLEIIKAMPIRERMTRIKEITAWEQAQRQTR